MTPEVHAFLAYAYWLVGAASLFVHLANKVAEEPGTWGDFFADKRNVLYLMTATALTAAGMVTYAVTDGTQTIGAIMFASAIGLAGGSLGRNVSPSTVAKARKVNEECSDSKP